MNAEILNGTVLRLKGGIREHVGLLTDNQAEQAAGRAEKLAGTVQEEYGYAMERVRQERQKREGTQGFTEPVSKSRG